MSIHLLSNIQSPSLSVFHVTIFLIRSRLVFVAYQTRLVHSRLFSFVCDRGRLVRHLHGEYNDFSEVSFCRRETGERKKWWEWRWEQKEAQTFSLFPSSTASFFFALFSLEYRAGAPAKDYVHLLAFTFTIRTFMTSTRRKRQQRGVCVWGGGGGGSIQPNVRILEVFSPLFSSNHEVH